MKRLAILLALSMTVPSNTGCIMNKYSADDNIRTEQLLFQSADYRPLRDEWRHCWFTDMPSHLNPELVHGGIGN
jgi:hypothetical protein